MPTAILALIPLLVPQVGLSPFRGEELPVEMGLFVDESEPEAFWEILSDDTSGSIPPSDTLATATATWNAAEITTEFGFGLHLSGKVWWSSLHHERVDWVQGLQVLVSKRPDDQPDWASARAQHDALVEYTLMQADGTFDVHVRARSLKLVPGVSKYFAVGLVPMMRRGDKLVVSNETPMWLGCQGQVAIQGPDPISATMQTIVASPGLDPLHFNPALLLAATNHLRALGRKSALANLDAFGSMALRVIEAGPADPANAYTADETSLLPIVRLLFDPPLGEKRQPPRASWMVRADPQVAGFPVAHYPLLVEDGVPFLLPWIGGRTGPPDPPMSLVVDWASAHGRLIEAELIPSDEPLEVAERVYRRIRQREWDAQGLYGDRLAGDPRWQAWTAVEYALAVPRPSPAFGCLEDVPEATWLDLRALAKERGLHWDRTFQRYATSR